MGLLWDGVSRTVLVTSFFMSVSGDFEDITGKHCEDTNIMQWPVAPGASSQAWYFALSLLRLVNGPDRETAGVEDDKASGKRHLSRKRLACAQALTKLPGVNLFHF